MESKEKTKQHFNETAADYNNSNDGKFVTPMYASLLKEIHKSQTGRILDVGCGNGNLFSFLSNEQYELFGIDFSENMIAEAKKSFSEKASFFVADAEELPFADNTIDIITCNASFHHYVHPNTVLAEMKRVLKDGGKLLIGDPYPPFVIRPIMNLLPTGRTVITLPIVNVSTRIFTQVLILVSLRKVVTIMSQMVSPQLP